MPNDVPMEVAALIGCCVTTGVGAVINASRIIAVDLHDHKLEFTKRFGATDLVNAAKVDPVQAIRKITGGGVDFAFDAYGDKLTISQALNSVRKTGTAVRIGLAPVGDFAPVDMS